MSLLITMFLKFNKSCFDCASIISSIDFPVVLACSLNTFIKSLSAKIIFLNSSLAPFSKVGLNLKSLFLKEANLCLE